MEIQKVSLTYEQTMDMEKQIWKCVESHFADSTSLYSCQPYWLTGFHDFSSFFSPRKHGILIGKQGPAVVCLHDSSDNSDFHAVTVWDNQVYDSNCSHAFELTEENLSVILGSCCSGISEGRQYVLMMKSKQPNHSNQRKQKFQSMELEGKIN